MKDREIVIFTHYGNSEYLFYTLGCAKKTNADARLIFLGDEFNRSVAVSAGWEFHQFTDYLGSDLDQLFLRVFKHIQGKRQGMSRSMLKKGGRRCSP